MAIEADLGAISPGPAGGGGWRRPRPACRTEGEPSELFNIHVPYCIYHGTHTTSSNETAFCLFTVTDTQQS